MKLEHRENQHATHDTTRTPFRIRVVARRDPGRTVQDLMRPPVEVRPHDTVEEALRLAEAHDLDALLVTREGKLLGSVSRWELAAVDPELTVEPFVRPNVATVSPWTTAAEAAEIFREHAPSCLVVVLRGIAGLVTRRELRGTGFVPNREDHGPYLELGGSG